MVTFSLSFSGGDVALYVFDINQPSVPTPFYSVLVSRSKAQKKLKRTLFK